MLFFHLGMMMSMSVRTDAARQTLEGWNMNINPELCKIKGRVLPPEKIFQGQNKSVSND